MYLQLLYKWIKKWQLPVGIVQTIVGSWLWLWSDRVFAFITTWTGCCCSVRFSSADHLYFIAGLNIIAVFIGCTPWWFTNPISLIRMYADFLDQLDQNVRWFPWSECTLISSQISCTMPALQNVRLWVPDLVGTVFLFMTSQRHCATNSWPLPFQIRDARAFQKMTFYLILEFRKIYRKYLHVIFDMSATTFRDRIKLV